MKRMRLAATSDGEVTPRERARLRKAKKKFKRIRKAKAENNAGGNSDIPSADQAGDETVDL